MLVYRAYYGLIWGLIGNTNWTLEGGPRAQTPNPICRGRAFSLRTLKALRDDVAKVQGSLFAKELLSFGAGFGVQYILMVVEAEILSALDYSTY